MAKCVSSRLQWIANVIELEDKEFLADIPRVGENLLNLRCEDMNNLAQNVVNDYFRIKFSAQNEDDKWDCYQVQDSLLNQLDNLLTDIPSIIQSIIDDAKLINATKHRYFMHFSSACIHILRKLLLNVGRLSDISNDLYLEEQRNPMVSEQSMTVHSLTSIWLSIIELMNYFVTPAKELFKAQLTEDQDYCFIKEMEFWISGPKFARIFIMDFISTSWIQFNRLVKYEDLLKNLPFLCPCHRRTYFRILEIATNDFSDTEFLLDLLSIPLDSESKPFMLAQSVREISIVPCEPFYDNVPSTQVAYFILWHLFSLSKTANDDKQRELIVTCTKLMEQCFDITIKQFLPPTETASDHRLSPHQEERFKLIFAMLDNFYEKNRTASVGLVIKMIEFFCINWTTFNEKYFDNNSFRVEKLTIFQMFTKIVYEIVPIKTLNGHAVISKDSDKPLTADEAKLNDLWDKLLANVPPSK